MSAPKDPEASRVHMVDELRALLLAQYGCDLRTQAYRAFGPKCSPEEAILFVRRVMAGETIT